MSDQNYYLNYAPEFDPDDPGDPNFNLRRQKLKFFSDLWDKAHALIEQRMPTTNKNFTINLEMQYAEWVGAEWYAQRLAAQRLEANEIADGLREEIATLKDEIRHLKMEINLGLGKHA